MATRSTPRRLVLRAEISARQPDREETVWGPSVKVARDSTGTWTKAAEGFARKLGAAPADLQEAVKDPAAPQDLYLAYARRTPGRPAAEVLPSLIAATLRALAFPKRMSWDAWLPDGKGAFPFGRPIRWLVALLGGEVVPFRIYELRDGARGDVAVESGRTTLGHRFLPRGNANQTIGVRSFDDLVAALRVRFVLVDGGERAARIAAGLAAAGFPGGDDHGLRQEWESLVEHPTVLAGRLPVEFKSLPREVLETVLVHHQKYVPLVREDAVEGFAAVTDGDGLNAAEIVRGMERVVVARLRDAAFFFAEDGKRTLASRVDDLAGVTFHRGLGSYRDKAARMAALVDGMGLPPAVAEEARQGALLAKADLTTLMVREFPELQGVMGALYLDAEGSAPPATVDAVRWHYHPVSVDEGAAPAGELRGDAAVFAAVSLADKLDSLAGYFGLDLAPSGSSDPFGLRRAGQGAVRVLLDFWSGRGVSLRALAARAVAAHASLKKDAAATTAELEAFLLDRLRYVLVARGIREDEVEAVVSATGVSALDDPQSAHLRAQALHIARREAPEDFAHLAIAFKRANSILQQAAKAGFVHLGFFKSNDSFQPGPERELYEALESTRAYWGGSSQFDRKHFNDLLRSTASIRRAVDRFFDEVLVMDPDEDNRRRRLELVNLVVQPVLQIADISKLGG